MRHLDRLRDIVDFACPYLLDRDRWWRTDEFNGEHARDVN
jgi:hypothetical protein